VNAPEALPILSASRAKDARACKRLHQTKYLLGFRPAVEDEVLRFGSLIHGGLEAWWDAAHGGADRLEAALSFLDAGPTDAFDRARAEAMLRGYDARWGDEQLRVVGVEVEFRAPLRNPQTNAVSRTWQLGGKIDAIVELADGRVMLVEHKTSSEDVSPGSEYWKRLRMDGQVSVYFEGARALGIRAEGMIYDVLKKPGLRPSQIPLVDDEGVKIVVDASGARVRTKDGKKWRQTGDSELGYVVQTRAETADEYLKRLLQANAEDPNAFFARGDVVRLEAEMDEALFDLWSLARELRDGELANRHPRNPDACVRYGRTCPFFGVCAGEASLDDANLFRRSENVHPELATASA
jgi:hypothetical protein